MSVQVEKLENSMVKLTIEVSKEDFDKACNDSYLKNRNKFDVPGFRKGKIPRQMIEKMYGKEIFFEEAANSVMPEAYAKAYDEAQKEVEIMSQPEIDVVQIEAGKPFIFTATVATRPEVTLGQYKGIEVSKCDVEVTDEDVDKAVAAEQHKNARTVVVTDRSVESGDTIMFNFEGFVDGEPFEGGKATDYSLEIGSNSFIPGFEEQLVGAEIEKEIEVNVTFPEDYHAKDLAGKPAVFKCFIKGISEMQLPEIDDEFASDISDFDTVDEWKASLKETILADKKAECDRKKKDECVEAAAEAATIDIPDAIIETETRNMVEDFGHQMQNQGLSMEQYMKYTGLTWETLEDQMRGEAVNRVRSRLVLEAIAKAEGLEVSDDDLNAELQKMADTYNMDIEKVKGYFGEEELKIMKRDMLVQRAVDFIAENAVEVEKAEEAEDAE